jgi:hypothetical protein
MATRLIQGQGGDQCGTADQFILSVHIYASLFAALFFGTDR